MIFLPAIRNLKMKASHQLSSSDFVNKTWACFSCSPLFNFNRGNLFLYSRNLTLFVKRRVTTLYSRSEDEVEVSAAIGFEKWLSSTKQTVEGLRIKLTNAESKVLIEIWLLDFNAETHDLFPGPVCDKRNGSSSRSDYNEILVKPLLLCHGRIKYRNSLLSWLEETFDCHTCLLRLNPVDLTWIISMWASISNRKDKKTENIWPEFTWKIPVQEDGLDSISFSLEPQSLTNIWKSCNEEDSDEILHKDVREFMNALNQFLFELFCIRFDSLPLIEVTSSFGKVNAGGVLKINSEANVWNVFSQLCSFSMERLHF